VAKKREFFEVFKHPEEQPKPQQPRAEEGDKRAKPFPQPVYQSAHGYHPRPGISITPGRITLSLSHMGAVMVLFALAVSAVAIFGLGVMHGARAKKVTPQKLMSKVTKEPEKIVNVEKISTWKQHELKRPAAAAPAPAPAKRAEGNWALQLISGIPRTRADQIARELRARGHEAEAFGSGKRAGVKVGRFRSPDSVEARQAKALFKNFRYDGKLQFSDCDFVKVK